MGKVCVGVTLKSERGAVGTEIETPKAMRGERSGEGVRVPHPSRLAAPNLGERRNFVSSQRSLPILNLVHFNHKIRLLVTFLTKMKTRNGDRKVQLTTVSELVTGTVIHKPIGLHQCFPSWSPRSVWGNAVPLGKGTDGVTPHSPSI